MEILIVLAIGVAYLALAKKPAANAPPTPQPTSKGIGTGFQFLSEIPAEFQTLVPSAYRGAVPPDAVAAATAAGSGVGGLFKGIGDALGGLASPKASPNPISVSAGTNDPAATGTLEEQDLAAFQSASAQYAANQPPLYSDGPTLALSEDATAAPLDETTLTPQGSLAYQPQPDLTPTE